MRNAFSILLIVVMLSSCATTIKLDESSPQPFSQSAVAWTALCPGLPQVLNKEYVKGAAIGALSLGAMAVGINVTSIDGEARPGYELANSALIFTFLGGMIFSYFDGQLNAAILNNQWYTLHPSQAPVPIRIGMTKSEFLRSMPNPTEINRTQLQGMVSEQWVYANKYGKTRYYYFDNDILTAMQN